MERKPEFGEDATNLFNLLTGNLPVSRHEEMIVAPFDLHARLLEQLIEREIGHAKRAAGAHRRADELPVEPTLIGAFYRASQAGVKIDLIVRGICCLRPGLKGGKSSASGGSFSSSTAAFIFLRTPASRRCSQAARLMPRNLFRRDLRWYFPSKMQFARTHH